MTRIADAPPASTGSPGAGPDENKVGILAVIGGFFMGGPVGGIIMAMAVGVQRAFGKAGWQQPGWLGGDRPAGMGPQERELRRAAAVAEAREWMREANNRALERRLARAEHRRRMREHVNSGGQGDKPVRPDRRGLGQVLGDGIRTSKARYRLLDDKLARGNEKVNDAYAKIGRFGRGLWAFGTGLAEGAAEGWQRWKDQRAGDDQSVCADCGGPNDSYGRICFACLHARYPANGEEAGDGQPRCPTCGGPNNSFDPVCFACREDRNAPNPEGDQPAAEQPAPQSGTPPLVDEEDDPPPATDEEISRWKHEMLGECDCRGDCQYGPNDRLRFGHETFGSPRSWQEEAPDGDGRGPVKAQAWIGEQPAIGGPTPDLTSGPAGPAEQGDDMDTESGALATPQDAGAVAHVGPQGLTNLDQLLERFRPLGPLLTSVEEGVDELGAEKREVLHRVTSIAALVAAKGAPMIVHETMQEAQRVAAALSEAINEISLQTNQAQELVLQALYGLEPARAGQDTLHAAGASGDVNDRVGT